MFKLDLDSLFGHGHKRQLTEKTANLANKTNGNAQPLADIAEIAISHDGPYCSESWKWPNSDAMNGREVDLYRDRMDRYLACGLTDSEAEDLADRLLVRDRDPDERVTCMECCHLGGFGAWSCGNWRKARLGDRLLPSDFVTLSQRCPGFQAFQFDKGSYEE